LLRGAGLDIIDIKEMAMSDFLIRRMPPRVKRKIEERARAHRRSLSAEAIAMLQQALASAGDDRKLGSEMFNMIRPEDRGDDLVFEMPGDLSKPPDFE
jgi:plasmid stability protein